MSFYFYHEFVIPGQNGVNIATRELHGRYYALIMGTDLWSKLTTI
jgi:hypothetical protein